MRAGIFLLFLLIISCSENKRTSLKMEEKLQISVIQNNIEIPIKEDTVELRRNSFSILIKFKKPDSVLVNASFSPETYNNSQYGNAINELTGFRNAPIAEELFNKNRILYVSKSVPGIWYYTNESDHRFNNIVIDGSTIICQRDIKKIINLDEKNSENDIIDFEKDNIFLVFIKTRWSEDFTREVEISRRVLKINFSI